MINQLIINFKQLLRLPPQRSLREIRNQRSGNPYTMTKRIRHKSASSLDDRQGGKIRKPEFRGSEAPHLEFVRMRRAAYKRRKANRRWRIRAATHACSFWVRVVCASKRFVSAGVSTFGGKPGVDRPPIGVVSWRSLLDEVLDEIPVPLFRPTLVGREERPAFDPRVPNMVPYHTEQFGRGERLRPGRVTFDLKPLPGEEAWGGDVLERRVMPPVNLDWIAVRCDCCGGSGQFAKRYERIPSSGLNSIGWTKFAAIGTVCDRCDKKRCAYSSPRRCVVRTS